MKDKNRKIYLTQKGEDAYQEAHTFYKFGVKNYEATITISDKKFVDYLITQGYTLVSIYKDYSL